MFDFLCLVISVNGSVEIVMEFDGRVYWNDIARVVLFSLTTPSNSLLKCTEARQGTSPFDQRSI
jgi:hypothetical protein